MPNISTPNSSIYNGWFYNGVDGRYDLYVQGTKVSHITATELQVDKALDADGAANFAGEVELAANLHAQLTIEAGADSVGAASDLLESVASAAVRWKTPA